VELARDHDVAITWLNSKPDSLPASVLAIRADLTEAQSGAAVVAKVIDRFGRLDVIVNNAGNVRSTPKDNFDATVYRAIFDVNLLAPAALARAAAIHWIDAGQPGSVVNIASISGLKGKALVAGYSASKGAMMRLTEALSNEWARYEIRVNTIAPGGFVTEAQAAVLDDPVILEARLRKIPLRRMADPTEIGPLTNYLVSPLSGFVTGSCFVIDGGEVARL